MPSAFFGLVSVEAYIRIVTKLNDCFVNHKTLFQWCWHFLPLSHSAMPWVYIFDCCIWVLTCEFVGRLLWNGQFQGFNSPTSAFVCSN
jgi:hypothetical protein